jgi:hypothetical protein
MSHSVVALAEEINNEERIRGKMLAQKIELLQRFC